jgi:hypothetical protein
MATIARPHLPGLALALALAPQLACSGDDTGASGTATASASGITGITSITGASESDSDSDSVGGGSSGGMKLDLPDDDTDGLPGGADCGSKLPKPGDPDFSIIWIANTGQGTVSKIDTVNANELARYRTGPGNPDPSRTSVNLRGDVAVANRAGGVTKIAARLDSCVDSNQNGIIDTSLGPNDIRPWGEDECVLWYHPMSFPQGLDSNQGGPRGIAWDGGQTSDCFATAKVWVGWRDQPSNNVKIRRIDGITGQTDDEVTAPDWQCNWGHGTYGAAADQSGAFWGLGTRANLVYVHPQTLQVERYQGPDVVLYGIALDADGVPWLGGWDGHLWRFDLGAKTFQDMGGGFTSSRLRGLAIDKEGHAWIAGNSPCALIQYDTKANTIINGGIALPGCGEPVGVSIDRYEQVWVVDREADRAYRVDPDTYQTVTVDGLVDPYTYSDMTGQGLSLVVNPPVG